MFLKTTSIKSKITILFTVLIIALLALFIGVQIIFSHAERGEFFHKMRKDAPLFIKEAMQAKSNGQKELTVGDVKLLFGDDLEVNYILPPREGIFSKPDDFRPPPPREGEINGVRLRPASYNNNRVVELEKDNFKAIAIDLRVEKSIILIWSLFFAVTLFITALYVFILKSLRPLKELQSSIEKFGQGSFTIDLQINSNDEIGQIAKAFNEAAKHVKYLIDSKDIFLKNAAHELRTPITKGIITVHLLPENRDKEILLNAFKRLETISESVLSLERFSGKQFELDLQPIMLKALVLDAVELLFLEPEKVVAEFEDMPILADETMMTIAFKNLIDNAVKFANDGKARICIINGKVAFKNLSVPLEEPIDKYFEAFYKETSIRNARGSGLGLFLAQKIINAHGLKVDYQYENGYVTFLVG